MKNLKMLLKRTKDKLKARFRNSAVPVVASDATIIPASPFKFFILCVIVPNLLFLFYMLVIQSKRYEVYAEIVLKDNSQSSAPTGLMPFINFGGSKLQDLEMIKRFIFSYEFLNKMDKEFNLKNYYKNRKGVDFFSSYKGNTMQSFLEYFESKVTVEIDKENQIMRIYLNDFSNTQSYQMLSSLLLLSEEFVNGVNEKLIQKQIAISGSAVDSLMDRIKELRKTITEKQILHNTASPMAEFEKLNATIVTLEADLLKQQSYLSEMEAYLSPNSLQVIVAKQKISNIAGKIKSLKNKILSKDGKGGEFLSVDFEALEMEMQILIKEYQFAISSLEQSKISIMNNTKHIIIVTEPFVTDYAKYPRIFYNILLSLLVTTSMYILIKATINIIKEHENY